MRKAMVATTLGLLLVIVGVILAVNIGFYSGRLSPCIADAQRSVRSPYDSSAVTLATASCGEKRHQISVRLASSGKAYQLLLAYSEAPDPPVGIAWLAANHIELRYLGALKLSSGRSLRRAVFSATSK